MTELAREIDLRVRGSAATARWVARDPTARKAAQVKVRSKFYAKNVETTKSSKLALAEELATLGGCEPTLLTVAGALDSRSASSYIAELRLRHVELDFVISPALDWAFKKVNDAVTRGLGPVKKPPEVKLSTVEHDTDTLIVGSADASVISLHWLLRADETEGLSLGMTSLFLHEGMFRLPTSETDPKGNGASRRLTCICKLPFGGRHFARSLPRLCTSPPGFSSVLVVWLGDRRGSRGEAALPNGGRFTCIQSTPGASVGRGHCVECEAFGAQPSPVWCQTLRSTRLVRVDDSVHGHVGCLYCTRVH